MSVLSPGSDPGPVDILDEPGSRARLEQRIEEQLAAMGHTILVRPDQWARDVDSATEAWVMHARMRGLRWEASVYWFPGHRVRGVLTKPHWCAQALFTDDGAEIELKDHGEHATLAEAQAAAVGLVRDSLTGLLAMVPA